MTLEARGIRLRAGLDGTRYAFTARFPGTYESVSGTVDVDSQTGYTSKPYLGYFF